MPAQITRAGIAVASVAPAVVRADDLVAAHLTQRKRGAAMEAQVVERVRCALGVTPDDECLVEQVGGVRRVAN